MNSIIMKTRKTALVVLLFVSALFVACQPEEEAPAGRDVYIAAWTLNETSSQIGATSYTVHINAVTANTTQVQIENFYNFGFSFKAIADINGNTMTLAQQTYNGNQLHGSGTKTGTNSINMSYYVNNGTTIDTCTAILSRQ